MFGKIKWLTLIMLVFLFAACELENGETNGEKKTHTESFTSSRSYEFNIGYPTTVEIYAGGAGGGGAGGYWVEGGLFLNDYYNCGGAGGGGAVEHHKFDINKATNFTVTIGAGGEQGYGRKRTYWERTNNTGWLINEEGSDGGSTFVNWEGGSLSAQGGKGGGTVNGGAGGTSSTNGTNGASGNNGIKDSRTQTVGPSTGGSGGFNNIRAGKGGNGGGTINKNPQAGERGENGQVTIVFTWYE